MSRFVILGSSPNRHLLRNSIFDADMPSATVIGLNRVPAEGFKLDYWVVWDTHDMLEDEGMVKALNNTGGYYNRPYFRDTGVEIRLPLAGCAIAWFDGLPQHATPADWALNKLPCRGSVCTTASALAYVLGATEIWLVGVDFATPGPTPDWTQEVLDSTAKHVNEFYKDFPIPVYKTFNGGPLELEYREYGDAS